ALHAERNSDETARATGGVRRGLAGEIHFYCAVVKSTAGEDCIGLPVGGSGQRIDADRRFALVRCIRDRDTMGLELFGSLGAQRRHAQEGKHATTDKFGENFHISAKPGSIYTKAVLRAQSDAVRTQK